VQLRARAEGKQGPGRTVRVVLFAAEENSVSGGKAYLAAHKNEASSYVLAMEADTGSDRAVTTRFLGDDSGKSAFTTIASGLLPLGITPSEHKAHGGTDVGFMIGAGVPTIDVGQDVSRYFDVHHTAADTSDKLDAHAMAQVSAGFAHVVYEACDPRVSFGRAPLKAD
jgi:Zn-dependent M28 family amino/carboxypeptidase